MKNENKKSSNKTIIGLIIAFIGGIAAVIFLVPWTGKRARSWVSQKTSHLSSLSERISDKAEAKARYSSGIIQGYIYKIKTFFNPHERADLDDDIVSQRVQTALGENPLTWDLPRINVNSEDRTVTIRGPVNSVQQLHDVESVVKNVKGVKRVINDLRIAS